MRYKSLKTSARKTKFSICILDYFTESVAANRRVRTRSTFSEINNGVDCHFST